MQVTKDTNLGEIAHSYPQAAQIMLEYGLHCVGCHFNTMDSVAMGAKIHGMSDEEVDEMVGRINDSIGAKP